MARVERSDEEAFGNDSFLDVVANIVGVLIILVVVASMRIKHLPSLIAPQLMSRDKAAEALAETQSQTESIEREILDLTAELQHVSLTAASRYQERAVLAQYVSQHERDLEEKRGKLSGHSREEMDLEQAKSKAQAELADYARERQEIDTSEPPTVEIMAYPTPLSKTVHGLEAHYQLKHGLIASVPFEDLLRKCKHKAQSQFDRLLNTPEFSDTVGPIDGFRMKYTIERVDVPPEPGHGGGSYARIRGCVLIPMSSELGEPVEEALQSHSQFYTSLMGLDTRTTTITLWTYNDSFALFRKVRKQLHEMGFAVAGRPLHEGQPIGASADGTKSSAQ